MSRVAKFKVPFDAVLTSLLIGQFVFNGWLITAAAAILLAVQLNLGVRRLMRDQRPIQSAH